MFLELTTDTLQEELSTRNKTVVLYGAGWCGNCRILKPKVKRLASQIEDINFIYIDAEKNPNSRQLATVDNLPTVVAFEGTTNVGQAQGNKIEILTDLIEKF